MKCSPGRHGRDRHRSRVRRRVRQRTFTSLSGPGAAEQHHDLQVPNYETVGGMSQPGEEVAKRLGRPRDPDIEDRVYDAAMEIYSQLGWPGFTFEAITKATGIGKAAVYRRWSSRGQLLAETFEHRWLTVDEIDSGSLREDLIQLVAMFLDRMTGRYGMAFVHMWIDRVNYPEAQD